MNVNFVALSTEFLKCLQSSIQLRLFVNNTMYIVYLRYMVSACIVKWMRAHPRDALFKYFVHAVYCSVDGLPVLDPYMHCLFADGWVVLTS